MSVDDLSNDLGGINEQDRHDLPNFPKLHGVEGKPRETRRHDQADRRRIGAEENFAIVAENNQIARTVALYKVCRNWLN
jgi:hypothetical protein